jgi:hypothetical protein
MLFRNLPRMRWLTRAQRSLGYLELARRARWDCRNKNLRRGLWLALRESPFVLSHRWRQHVADQMIASLDFALGSAHRAVLQRVVACDEGLAVLIAYGVGSKIVVRWTYMLRNLWSRPRLTAEKHSPPGGNADSGYASKTQQQTEAR